MTAIAPAMQKRFRSGAVSCRERLQHETSASALGLFCCKTPPLENRLEDLECRSCQMLIEKRCLQKVAFTGRNSGGLVCSADEVSFSTE
jgi:hypothetical protein